MFGIQGMLAPVPVETFVRENLGQRGRYIEGPADKFEGLFSWADINHLLNTARPKNSIKLVHQKTTLPQEQLANLSHWLNEGATLVIDWLQYLDEFVYRFSQELGRDVNAPVNINCYTSCPNKQGFDLHFDKHDVFIVQVEGSKRWHVFEPTLIKKPLQVMQLDQDQCGRPDPKKQDPYCSCTLNVGDVLYIPRGHWHYAVAETPSVHLTVGIESITGINLLQWITSELMDGDEFFRGDIPVFGAEELGGPGGAQSLTDYVEEFKSRVKKTLDSTDLVDLIVRRSMLENQIKREARLPFIWDLDNSLLPETRFSLLASQKALKGFDPETKSTVIYLRGSVLNLADFPEPLVDALFSSQGTFSGTSLMEQLPELTWEQVKPLLVKMYQGGVIINLNEDE